MYLLILELKFGLVIMLLQNGGTIYGLKNRSQYF